MSAARAVLLLGGGGHAAVVADAVIANGWRIAGFLDDDPATEESGARLGMKRLGAIPDLARMTERIGRDVIAHAATGHAPLRRRWLAAAGEFAFALDPIRHPSAVVSPSADIADGVFIGPRAVVNARSVIGRGVIINSGAIIEHDVEVGAWAHVAPGSIVAGRARVGEAVLIGCGAVVLPGVNIGRGATLGGGAVANDDVPEGLTAVGVPARTAAAVADDRA